MKDRVIDKIEQKWEKLPNAGEFDSPIHDWFELSYASWLTIPRVLMEQMPKEWQERMVSCLNELDSTWDWRPKDFQYYVNARGFDGKYKELPRGLCNYRRPDIEFLISIVKDKECYLCQGYGKLFDMRNNVWKDPCPICKGEGRIGKEHDDK